MFYRFFGKSHNSKASFDANSSDAAPSTAAATAAAASGSATPATGGGNSAPAAEAHGASHNRDGGSAVSGGARGFDRRAFQGEERLLEYPRGPRRYPLDPDDDAELLVLLAQQYSITSVVITHYRVKENYVEYVIECVRGYDAWRVYRRYQQFKTLDHDLRQLCVGRHGSNHGAYGVVPVLPGSHWMDVTNQSPELVEQRRRYLEIYLQQLLVPKNLFYVARTALFDFLHDGEVPTNLKSTGIQPLLGLISTRTNQIDCDNSDEAIQREQQQHESQRRPAQQSSDANSHNQNRNGNNGNREGDSAAQSSGVFPGTPAAVEADASYKAGTPTCTTHAGLGRSPSPNEAAPLPQKTATGPSYTAVGSHESPSSQGAVTFSAASSTHHASGEQASRDNHAGESHAARSENYEGKRRPQKSNARTLAEEAALAATASLQMSFTDERLPPASANCAQCNAEFTSFLYPHRCFFCRVQFCTTCLQKVALLESGSAPASAASAAPEALALRELRRSPLQIANASREAGSVVARSVLACRQCAENYSRRLDRCIAAPGGGAYRGMQSTLAPPTPGTTSNSGSGGSGLSTLGGGGGGACGGNGSLQTSPGASSSPSLSPAACVGGERSSMMLQKRNTGPGSPQLRGSPSGSFAGRSGGFSAVGFHDFQLLTVIGRGTFGKVLKVQHRSSGNVYAMKIMNKATVYKRCMTSYMKEEKSILTSMKPHPYIVRCYFAFQTDYYLVFVMDYLPGGELYDYLYPKLRLSPEATCTYAAELVLALEHLHRQDVVHRDLKPENVVLTADGHICLTDFGLARRAFSRSRRRSFVGSPEYVAPETIQGQVQTAAVDWWSFGIMLYEMLAGRTPFHARNNNTVYDNVLHKELKLPLLKTGGDVMSPLSPASPKSASVADDASGFKGFTSEAASLLSGLLARDASMRLQDATVIKKHPYFRDIDWEALRRKNVQAPCIPGDLRDNDVRHFKREFVSEWASVPPLTNMTRASIEALTRCFENFPVSRGSDSASSSSSASSALSPTTGSPQTLKSGASGSHPEMRALSPFLTLLPPSVLSTDARTLREPVHFARSLEAAQGCFHGVWRVVSVEVHALEDSRIIFPWGGDVAGVLIYSPGAHFSLQLSPSARRPMGPVQRVGQLSKEDLCDAYCSYIASFGRFQVFPSSIDDGCGVVRHYAEGNLCPNLMLTNTVFQYRMEAEPVSKSEERQRRKETQPDPNSTVDSLKGRSGVAESLPKPLLGTSTCDSESSVDGRASNSVANTTTTFVEAVEGCGTTTSPPPATPPKRRFVLRLSTRPQRAFEEDFMAFTSLVFEKME
ncbi:zinc finger protein kinase-like [Lotmaria passim]